MSSSIGSTPPELFFVLLHDGGLAPDGPDLLALLADALRQQYPNAALVVFARVAARRDRLLRGG